MGTLEKSVESLLKACKIDCYMIDGNISAKRLGINDYPSDVIEFDLLAKVVDVGIMFETTTQSERNIKKINKFSKKSDVFIEAHKKGTLNFNVFSKVPTKVRKELPYVSQWKFVYLGTSPEIKRKKIQISESKRDNNLSILSLEDLKYLEHMERCLGTHAKNDILKHLGIDPKNYEEPERELVITAIQLDNKKVLGTIDADVFLFQIPAADLLHLAHVPRYGYDNPSSTKPAQNYQRLPNKKKLEKISKIIHKGGGNYSFPNTVTVILPDGARIRRYEESIKKISIPRIRSSVEVIDGQHRIFGYARSKLSNTNLQKSKIMAVGLLFKKKKQNNAARIFVEVNREQTKVSKDLLLLLGYPILHEKTPEALTAHVISKLNNETGGALQGKFITTSRTKKTRSEYKQVPIVMTTNALSKMFDVDNKMAKNSPEKNIDYLYNMTSRYFRILKSNFAGDWKDIENTLVFSSKYLAAFMELLVKYREKEYSMNQIGRNIAQFKKHILVNKKHDYTNSAVFSRKNKHIPDIKADQTTITKFVLKYGLATSKLKR